MNLRGLTVASLTPLLVALSSSVRADDLWAQVEIGAASLAYNIYSTSVDPQSALLANVDGSQYIFDLADPENAFYPFASAAPASAGISFYETWNPSIFYAGYPPPNALDYPSYGLSGNATAEIATPLSVNSSVIVPTGVNAASYINSHASSPYNAPLGSVTFDGTELTYPQYEWVDLGQVSAAKSIPVNIYADAFIPSATIANPGCVTLGCLPGSGGYRTFAGDNRGISPTPGGSYRIAQAITVNASPGASSPVISTWSDTGVTTGYDSSGQPHYGKASTSGLTETATENANGVTVQIDGSAGNPLVPVSVFGQIGQTYTVTISPAADNMINYSVTGATKYFPGYELYIGSQLVYGYNPVSTGSGPGSLLNPLLTNSVLASGVISDSVAAGDGPGSTSFYALQPTSSSTIGGETTFAFDNVQSGSWFDPLSASTFVYTMLSDSDFSEILGFPSGFQAFEVFVGGVDEGSFASGDTFEFPAGTTSFAVSGVSPLGEPFPLQLAFNTPTASFDVTVASAPEPSTWAMILVGFACLGFAGYRRTLQRV
jgi:hypothetical protein